MPEVPSRIHGGEQRAEGLTASEALRQLLPTGQEVFLMTYKDGREKYGRYLAEVGLENETTMYLTNVNDWMVRNGYAVAAEY